MWLSTCDGIVAIFQVVMFSQYIEGLDLMVGSGVLAVHVLDWFTVVLLLITISGMCYGGFVKN